MRTVSHILLDLCANNAHDTHVDDSIRKDSRTLVCRKRKNNYGPVGVLQMFAGQHGHHLVFVMEVKPKSTLIPLIIERLKVRKCICGCGEPQFRNGLSRKCHYAHEKDMYALAPEQRPEFVCKRIRKGLWLTAELGRVLRSQCQRRKRSTAKD